MTKRWVVRWRDYYAASDVDWRVGITYATLHWDTREQAEEESGWRYNSPDDPMVIEEVEIPKTIMDEYNRLCGLRG